ncbi:hypothetical protein NLJ89_g2147 [Agrocybe chaxingu]|uniref:Uncharacterized protein n=1 Tax=Agrocybe chaxingu TaxID=84603 RepID=A0A9W8KCK3_9AGAR|nr:hypothetical protein NLJ89_g2147 [Agrocybe chaxingu]
MYYGASFKLKAWAKSTYARITLNRYTLSFFVFSFLYCVVQGMIQSFLFSLDWEYSTLVNGLVDAGQIPKSNLTYLEGTSGNLLLRMCNDIPHGQSPYPCMTVFESKKDSPKYGGVAADISRGVFDLSGWERGLNMTVLRQDPQNQAIITAQCIKILLYPSQILINFKREDIAWICLQFWLFGISVLAILNDSVPHTLAVLMTRFISTAWALYAIWRGPTFRSNWQQLIADPGTICSLDVFNEYWSRRRGFEIADGVLSATAFLIFIYLSWTLLRVYNAQSFKCVGAPPHIIRINKFFMAVLACLQMEAFVLVTGMGLWIDILINTAIAPMSEHTELYQAGFIFSAVALLPWIAMGWYSIRREMKKLMLAFLAIGLVIITGWSVMFYSIVYRWSFMQWPYLGCFTTASLTLLLASMILGVVCRLNFGKGLAQYLHAEESLAKLNFAQDKFVHDSASIRSSVHYAKEIQNNFPIPQSPSKVGHSDYNHSDYDRALREAEIKGDEESAIGSVDTTSTYSMAPTRDSHAHDYGRLRAAAATPTPGTFAPNRRRLETDASSDSEYSDESLARGPDGAVRPLNGRENPAGRVLDISSTATTRQAPGQF